MATRILVGLDGSPAERDVLAAALQYAEALGGRLILFRALSLPAEIPAAAYGVPPERVNEILEGVARRHLEKLAGTLAPSRLDHVRVTFGTPWRSICEAAASEKVDLVVIGSHGYGGIDRLLGTTAAKVVNHLDRPVLVVRPH
jgi:nucleotide-binding universal stress UspA family protein